MIAVPFTGGAMERSESRRARNEKKENGLKNPRGIKND